MPLALSSNFIGAGHITVIARHFPDLEKSNRGGIAGIAASANRFSTPAEADGDAATGTARLRELANSRTAECESCYRARRLRHGLRRRASHRERLGMKLSATRLGIITAAERLYRQVFWRKPLNNQFVDKINAVKATAPFSIFKRRTCPGAFSFWFDAFFGAIRLAFTEIAMDQRSLTTMWRDPTSGRHESA